MGTDARLFDRYHRCNVFWGSTRVCRLHRRRRRIIIVGPKMFQRSGVSRETARNQRDRRVKCHQQEAPPRRGASFPRRRRRHRDGGPFFYRKERFGVRSHALSLSQSLFLILICGRIKLLQKSSLIFKTLNMCRLFF